MGRGMSSSSAMENASIAAPKVLTAKAMAACRSQNGEGWLMAVLELIGCRPAVDGIGAEARTATRLAVTNLRSRRFRVFGEVRSTESSKPRPSARRRRLTCVDRR